jgi:hypothetical protein
MLMSSASGIRHVVGNPDGVDSSCGLKMSRMIETRGASIEPQVIMRVQSIAITS